MKLLTWNCCLPPWSISKKRRIPPAYALESNLYQKTRKEQVLEIIKILKNFGGIQLLVGDFNFQPDTSPYQEIIKDGFVDPTSKEIKTIKNKRLDYIFTKKLCF